MARQKTIHEKWEIDSREEGGPIRFLDAPNPGKFIPMKGFTEEEMRGFLGDEGYERYKKQFDEIEES